MAEWQKVAFLGAVAVLLLPGFVHSFKPFYSPKANTISHRVITQRAILRKTAEVCRDMAVSGGRDFSLTISDSLSVGQVIKACSTTTSSIKFMSFIAEIYFSNGLVDVVYMLSGRHHFDGETFQAGRDLITAGVSSVKESVKQKNFLAGRFTLGRVCHTLQDFYSHSNWVELGNKAPYSALIRPDRPLEKLAGPDTPTCRSCTGGNCENNILPDVLQQGLLTSGYFNIVFLSSAKPAGKCSHGGIFDSTSREEPVGGINKDDTGSDHGHLHPKAANLAVNATVELLEDIRLAVGDEDFLQLMGLSTSAALCFVIDTTGSMSDDIAEAKRVSFDIIDRKRGTKQEPSIYILVPFNDPDFGPLIVTTDPDVFKAKINALSASGGGDAPDLSLSGLQLALTAAPPSSEIFVFTDAAAKDASLKNTIIALIETTKSVVTFMLTGVSLRSVRSLQTDSVLTESDAQLYRDLSKVSGGHSIEVAKSDLSLATSIIEDSSADAVVTVFRVVRNPGQPDNFTFTADGSLSNLIVYITGASALTFSLTSPAGVGTALFQGLGFVSLPRQCFLTPLRPVAGVSQNSSQANGPLASITTTGNLHRLKVSADSVTGSWKISVDSNNPYTIKVIGQSSVNFIFNTVEANEGAHGDFSLKEGRPLSGGNASVLITVTESETMNVTEVFLVDSSGRTQVNGSLQSMGGGDFLVTFSSIPAGDFVIRLRGEESGSASRPSTSSFQRQAPTHFRTSSISVTAQENTTSIEPGFTITIPFTVATTTNGVVNSSVTENFTVRATNDRGYMSTFPSFVTVAAGSGGTANATVSLMVPPSATSGTAVTLTIEAENAAGSDFNYVVLRFSVTAKVTDVTRPACQVVITSADCPASSSLCNSSRWEFTANITDGVNGTGISSVIVRRGNGALNTSTVVGAEGENVTVATYSASCCSETAELVAVDRTGHVVTCVGKAREPTTPSSAAHAQSMLGCLWISITVFLLWDSQAYI